MSQEEQLPKVLVLVEEKTPRIEYVFRFFSESWRVFHFESCLEKEVFLQWEGAKVDYTGTEACPISIEPNRMMLGTALEEPVFDIDFFQTISGSHPLPELFSPGQDIVAFVFFLVSRYEEYLPHETDAWGRYRPDQSVLWKMNMLAAPIADILTVKFFSLFSSTERVKEKIAGDYRLINTLDIDQAYAFQHKGFLRNMGGMLKDLSSLKLKWVWKRSMSLLRIAQDPYDTHDFILQVQKEYGFEQAVFILCGNKTAFDPNLPLQGKAMKALVKKYTSQGKIGIHPSYFTSENPSLLTGEKKALESTAGHRVEISRQHYLRFRLPETYRVLENAGIRKDFSMGYAKLNGFRAGTCRPYIWYDLSEERISELTVYPLSCMDGVFLDVQHSSLSEALAQAEQQLHYCKEYGGVFIPLFHNHTLSSSFRAGMGRELYQSILQMSTGKKKSYE